MLRSGDPDLEARVAAHRRRRDIRWETVEPGVELVATLATLKGSVLVDSLGPWVGGGGPGVDGAFMGASLAGALRDRTGDTVVVAEEVGMSVHPTTESGRKFQDALGAVNDAVSAVADRAYLVVAGRAMELPPRGFPG
jgi:nicotinate-nucleotide--dimethylbenzimidazole phosphoribosyltransferase